MDSEKPELFADSGWHLKKEIQLGHIVTTVVVAASAVVYINKIEQRIAVLESQTTEQQRRDERQDKVTADALHLMRTQLDRIDGKLDRIIERNNK